LEFMDMDNSLNTVYENSAKFWSQATDPQFYNKDCIFVDFAK
jgi:hypothetical protein